VPVKLKELSTLDGAANARFMKAQEFNRLVENLQDDGVLTSYPLIYKGKVLSGNHRVKAAIKAGIEDGHAIEILGELSRSRQLAIQLSHNAIVGEDDPNLLSALYGQLNLGDKLYSGLRDEQFVAEPLDLASLQGAKIEYRDILLTFLPEHESEFQQLLGRVEKAAKKGTVMVANMADFDRFFDALVMTKEETDIRNSAMAVCAMAKLATERLEQLEAEAESQDGQD
jgi:hypothetical protein